MLAKTAQKHDYPSAAWRRSYARRTGAERGFATAKDPATSDISRGWCRLMGLAPLMLFTATLLIVRNQRILHAWNTRQEENQRRAAAGPAPENPQTPPQDPRQPRHRTTLTRHHQNREPARHHNPRHHNQAPARAQTAQNPGQYRQSTPRRRHRASRPPSSQNVRGKRENDPH